MRAVTMRGAPRPALAPLRHGRTWPDHHHEVTGLTGLAIEVGHGNHVYFADGTTTENDEHVHGFQFATLIESPLVKNCPEHPHRDGEDGSDRKP